MNIPKVVSDPIIFRNATVNQISSSEFDYSHEPFLKVVLYFVWLGITQSRRVILQKNIESNLGFLCLATFKSFLPIIQNIRLGYSAAVISLLRAQMEQVALLGFLNSNPGFIPKYIAGVDLTKQAMFWAKKNTVKNWMVIYGNFSKVAHPMLESTATQIFDDNEIGVALQKSMQFVLDDKKSLSDEIIAAVIYTLTTLDTFIDQIIGRKLIDPQKSVIDFSNIITVNDLQEFQTFLIRFIEKHERLRQSKIHN
jgi:hypothetical protein